MHNPPCRGIFGVSPAPIMLPINTPPPPPLEIAKKRNDIKTKQLGQDNCAWTPSTPIKLIQGL